MQQSSKITLASKAYEVEDFAAAQEFYHSSGWTDGLPVVPPTESAVAACLEWALMPPDQLIGIEPVREQPITAEKLAINAVMAGCLPMHFPVVATAWQAMLKEEFLLHGVTSSTGGSAILVIINGPIRQEIGAVSTFNALANSNRATASIGRALRLSLINLLDARSGGIDRTTLGHPGKFSYCLAEDEEDTTWQPLSAVRGIREGLSAVAVMAALAPRQIMNEWSTEPREILETFAAEMRANQRHYSIYSGNYAIVIPKQLREPPAGPSAISPSSCMSARGCAAANGPMSAKVRWCVTAVKPSTRRWSRPITFWSWPLAALRAGSVQSFRPGSATRPKPLPRPSALASTANKVENSPKGGAA